MGVRADPQYNPSKTVQELVTLVEVDYLYGYLSTARERHTGKLDAVVRSLIPKEEIQSVLRETFLKKYFNGSISELSAVFSRIRL